MSTSSEEFPDEVTNYPGEDPGISPLEIEPVSPEMLFKFGKQILAVVAVLFVAGSTVRIWLHDNEGAKEVWGYATVFLNSVASLVLGYYFGKRDK